MKIELRNIKFSETFSEETNCFKADIYLDGKKVGYSENDGHGGSTNISGIGKYDSEEIKKMEEYCKTLSPILYQTISIPMNLENYIDQLFENWLKEKNKKTYENKRKKDMLKGLVLSVSDSQHSVVSWKGVTIEQLLSTPRGIETLKKSINKYKGEGYTILNTNIPQNIINP